MVPFLENTWLLWWLIAIVVIIRWFHLSVQVSEESDESVVAPDARPTLSPVPRRGSGQFF
jgi:hypothetical protein